MKCIECRDYKKCSKEGNLTIKRKSCQRVKTKYVMTNANKIRSMSDEELAEFLSGIAYGRETPWSKVFEEKCCKSYPVTKCEISDYLNPMFLHECDFDDGKCPHGSDVEWWLRQPAEEETQ